MSPLFFENFISFRLFIMMMNEMILRNGDCLPVMSELPANSFDLLITSPPYNVKIDYGTHSDDMSKEAYFDWLLARLAGMYRITKSGGRLCLNLPEFTSKGEGRWNIWELFPLIAQTGWTWRNTHIWYKPNHEGGSAWGSFKSPSCPAVRPDHEFIFVFYKENRKLPKGGSSDITKEEFSKFTKSVWSFPGQVKINSKGKNIFGHNAPFPEELPYRCLKLYSWVGAKVIDPFMGSGTAGTVCKETNRDFYGIELDAKIFGLASGKLAQ